MEIIAKVRLTGCEARGQFYGIIAEFYSSSRCNTGSARRLMDRMFPIEEIKRVPDMVRQAKSWYRNNPEYVEIDAKDAELWKALANYCYLAWQ